MLGWRVGQNPVPPSASGAGFQEVHRSWDLASNFRGGPGVGATRGMEERSTMWMNCYSAIQAACRALVLPCSAVVLMHILIPDQYCSGFPLGH